MEKAGEWYKLKRLYRATRKFLTKRLSESEDSEEAGVERELSEERLEERDIEELGSEESI